MAIKTVVDSQRGCGWRKPGGTYLRCDGLSSPCGKLPIPLCVCPMCGQGVKPSRGWTWVDGEMLIRSKKCETDQPEHCAFCPLGQTGIGRVGLLWIGEVYYPTPADWISEANTMGVSRRISAVPQDFEIGKTWVFVAHRKAIKDLCEACQGKGNRPSLQPDSTVPLPCEACDGAGATYTPAVFHAFKPTAVEYVVKGNESEEELAKLEKRGITPVKVVKDGELEFPLTA